MENDQYQVLSEIRERVVRVETKLDAMTDVRHTAEEAKEKAQEALLSSRSAHHRLNKIDKIIFWTGTTIIGAVILGVIALIVKNPMN
ncbi:hemolysin XhlA family protein [Ferviditalea candida]|uniref:Hemolysin XhlA family protein n=1 Tax=Ferviditalea candida TaxID=3108399 RepID=A0ABU5ZMJ6_9BACL|nr:hemolysin XhlA family protein [Paenibacillaceae bacterium T2]